VTSTQQSLRLGLPVWMNHTRGRTQRYVSLSGNHETNVAIVGGGMTGALVAHAFASAGIATTVVEAGLVGRGSTAASWFRMSLTSISSMARPGWVSCRST
jgi:ribulose 1,5-bisphosphate synthetase/thiazole synthase